MTVITASWSLRKGLRDAERNRFLASCWLMVEPPATMRPFLRFLSTAFSMPSQSKPSWARKRLSSAAMTARFRCTETRL